ncbi:MAG: NAD-dependent protein deacylase [Candidatus Dadabacteria bacterium]|nr:MAG: NAD-dependent protein deacylase [Candidatus Dadabacteria bacterium]
MSEERDPCQRAAELLREAERVLVLTGAGISTESGIPDFRSPGGLWDRYDPSELTYDRFRASEQTRRIYWQIAAEAYPVLRDARPNAAHRAVVAIERAGKLLGLVTQNVDGLHQKAGSDPAKVVEIHGTALRVTCIDCGREYDREQVHQRVLAGEQVPRCDACGGPLKPATISFGQAMPERETAQAFRWAAECDLAIVIGSSLVVYPAAAIPQEAVRAGARLIIVNREPTPQDSSASVVVRGSAGEAMTRIVTLAGCPMPPAEGEPTSP